MQQSLLWQGLPSKSGVYLFKDVNEKILYIGKAKDLKKRVSSYFQKDILDPRISKMAEHISSVEHILTPSEIDAFLLEANLIKKYLPFYNSRLSDDKFFPYLEIGTGKSPYVVITRKTGNPNSIYFGPYTNATSLKIVYKIMRRLFPFQSVKNHPRRKCLYYHLGLCPCVGVFADNLKVYKKDLRKLKNFLRGDKGKVIRELENDRDVASRLERYEEAKIFQDKINRINTITSEQFDPFQDNSDPTIYQQKALEEQKALTEIIQKYYPDAKSISRIECYDISNIQGRYATGSMVVMIDGIPDKKEYRKFRIRTKNTPDDFHMMKEVLSRRLKNTEWKYPELFVIDGGKGQVSASLEILRLKGIPIPLIGLAKREETIVIPLIEKGAGLFFVEEKLGIQNPAVNLLRRVRDEAHRFAISYHRLLRSKHLLSS